MDLLEERIEFGWKNLANRIKEQEDAIREWCNARMVEPKRVNGKIMMPF